MLSDEVPINAVLPAEDYEYLYAAERSDFAEIGQIFSEDLLVLLEDVENAR